MASLTVRRDKTALVVIDLQKGIVGMPTEPNTASDVVKNAAAIAASFRRHQMPVFLVRVTPSADGGDRLHPTADVSRAFPPRQPDWAEIVADMGPEEGDFVITKRQWGAFYGTELDLQLRRRGIDTIVLCGISTDLGVESTARYAYELGYQQIFAADAMAARTAQEHVHTVETIFPRLGLVRTTAEVLQALSA